MIAWEKSLARLVQITGSLEGAGMAGLSPKIGKIKQIAIQPMAERGSFFRISTCPAAKKLNPWTAQRESPET